MIPKKGDTVRLAQSVTMASDAQAPVTITAMDAVLLSRVLLKRLG